MRVKYPRTPHLPDSPGATSDDKWADDEAIKHLSSGIGLVVTEKMDGGNVSLYRDCFHARSLSSNVPSWEHRAKAEWARVRSDIPDRWRISCESLWARRSVGYESLPGPLLVIGVWNAENVLLGWDDTSWWSEALGLPTVPLLWRGTDFGTAVRAWSSAGLDEDVSEGFVLRNAGAFDYTAFSQNVGPSG